MKKIFISLVGIFILASCYANDAVISGIKSTNAKYKNIVCDFDEVKSIKMLKKEVAKKGKLYYEGEKMSMIYSEPAGEYFKITDTTLAMLSGKKSLKQNLKAGSQFMSLRNLLIFSMKGDIKKVAEMSASNIEYKTDGGYDKFTLTAKEKVSKGYNKVVLWYNKKSHVLEYMELHQPTGDFTTYTLSNLKFGTVIPNGTF